MNKIYTCPIKWSFSISPIILSIIVLCIFAGCGSSSSGNGPTVGSNSTPYVGFNGPMGIAIDGSGNVWAANAGIISLGNPNVTGTTVTELLKSNAGYSNNIYTGLNGPLWVAADSLGNIWVTNYTNNSVIELIAPTFSTTNAFSGTYFDGPFGVAVDGSGNIWTTNFGSISGGGWGTSVIEIKSGASSCVPTTCIVFSGGSFFNAPIGITADKNGNIWITNNGGVMSIGSTAGTTVTEIIAGATSCTLTNCIVFSDPSIFNGPTGIAADSTGNIWVSNTGVLNTNPTNPGTNVTEIVAGSSTCSPITCINFSGSSFFYAPFGIASDGANNIWVVSGGPSSNGPIMTLTEIKEGSSSCSSTTCVVYSGNSYNFNNPNAIAIDNSGNIWISNFGQMSPGAPAGATVIELKGIAAPTTTPIL